MIALYNFERYYAGADHSLSRGPKMLADGVTPGPTLFPKASARYKELFGPTA